MKHIRHLGLAMVAVAFAMGPAGAEELTGTLKNIKDTGAITLGFRDSSIPFSYLDDNQKPIGYAMDICYKIVEAVKKELKLDKLEVKLNPVTSSTRIPLLANGTIDLECAVAAITLSRLRQVDFSAMIWIDSKTFLVKRGRSVKKLADLAGKRVAVVANTTIEKILREVLLSQVLDGGAVTTEVVLLTDHREGLDALVRGSVDAVASDRMVLARLAAEAPDPQQLSVADYQFAYEPLALTLRRNDADFKFAVNQVLARLYRTGAVKQIYNRWFSNAGPPPPLLDSLYDLNGLRD